MKIKHVLNHHLGPRLATYACFFLGGGEGEIAVTLKLWEGLFRPIRQHFELVEHIVFIHQKSEELFQNFVHSSKIVFIHQKFVLFNPTELFQKVSVRIIGSLSNLKFADFLHGAQKKVCPTRPTKIPKKKRPRRPINGTDACVYHQNSSSATKLNF